MVSGLTGVRNVFVYTRVIYDRVRKMKNYFEIPAFLQIERGKSRAVKFKTSNENKNKKVFDFVFHLILNFPLLKFPIRNSKRR